MPTHITLYHWILDPAARMVRLALGEKLIAFAPIESHPLSPHEDLRTLPARVTDVVLTAHDNLAAGETLVMIGPHAILEYLEESYTNVKLLPDSARGRAEVRRIWSLMQVDFAREVNDYLLAERIRQFILKEKNAKPALLRKGAKALRQYMAYFDTVSEQRTFLANDRVSLADLAVAAYLSVLDYFGDVPWDDYSELRQWYMRIKSRPGFRPLLKDHIKTTAPAKHYANLDF